MKKNYNFTKTLVCVKMIGRFCNPDYSELLKSWYLIFDNTPTTALGMYLPTKVHLSKRHKRLMNTKGNCVKN